MGRGLVLPYYPWPRCKGPVPALAIYTTGRKFSHGFDQAHAKRCQEVLRAKRFSAAAFSRPSRPKPNPLSEPGIVFQIGVAPVRIDVLTSLSGLSFDEGWASRAEAVHEGLKFPIIGREALLRNKRATGRPKDLLDAEVLERDQGH